MSETRHVGWDGFFNARDLGGLPVRGGGRTRRGSLIRSADLRFVTRNGWQQARAAGVRTVVDLRNDEEILPGSDRDAELAGSGQFPAAPFGSAVPGMVRVRVPLDGIDDVEFWDYLNRERLNGTPLYFRPFLDHRPDRVAAAVTAIARAAPGGVVFHCGAGRDRTGLIALVLLALVDVEPDAIAADYTATTEPLRALAAAMGRPDEGPSIERTLTDLGTTARDAVLATLQDFNAETYLLSAGVTLDDLTAIRSRLLP
jgi:protein-tyrosine phosphatase